MLKSQLLSSVRPFLAPPNDDGKTEAQKQREAIKVESFKKDDTAGNDDTGSDDDKSGDDDTGKDDTTGDDDTGDDDGTTDDDNEDDDNKDDKKEEAKAKTAEELQKDIVKLERTIARLQKRVGKTTGEKNQIAQQLADATAALNSKVEEGKGLSEEEVERRANEKAEAKAMEREFVKSVNTLSRNATKVDPQFPTNIKELTEDVAPVPSAMIGVLEDLDNGGAVLAHLAANPDTYEEIYDLSLPKMASRLSKLSDKLLEEAKPKKKAISKVPAPLNTIKGSEKSPSILPANPTKNMDEYVRMRNQQTAQRRKERYG